jgi:hypothetical protein
MVNRRVGRPVGRPKGSVSKRRMLAHEVMNRLEAELGRPVNPLEGLLRIGSDPTQPVSIRVECMSECLQYLWPKLQSQSVAVSGPDDGPVQLAAVSVSLDLIRSNPELAHAAQTLSIGLSAAGSESAPPLELEAAPPLDVEPSGSIDDGERAKTERGPWR